MACLNDIDSGITAFWKALNTVIHAALTDKVVEEALLSGKGGTVDDLLEKAGCKVPATPWTIDVDRCYERFVLLPNDDGDGMIVQVPYPPKGANKQIPAPGSMSNATSAADKLKEFMNDRNASSQADAAACAYGCHGEVTTEPIYGSGFNRVASEECGGNGGGSKVIDPKTANCCYPKGKLTFEWS